MTRPAVADERDWVSRVRLPAAIGWLTVAPLVVSAAARVARLDESSSLLILADGLTPLLVPPALLALGIGLRQRRWTLAVLSAATAVAFLCWTIPAVGVPARVPPPEATSPALRLFNANLHAANPDVAPIAEEIRAAAPDLVALQEVDPDGAAGLLRSGVVARFPYRMTEIRRGASGIALWSRFPLAESQVLDVGGMPFIRATVVLGARRRLQRHPPPSQLSASPLAPVGRRHERRGRGWATTWPRGRWPLPPLMRLDHVLVTPEVTVQSVREGVGRGSDHRPLSPTWSYGETAQPLHPCPPASGGSDQGRAWPRVKPVLPGQAQRGRVRSMDGLAQPFQAPKPRRATLPLRPCPGGPSALPTRPGLFPLRSIGLSALSKAAVAASSISDLSGILPPGAVGLTTPPSPDEPPRRLCHEVQRRQQACGC